MFNKLFKKFLSFSYGGVVSAAIGFFTTMLTTRILSPEEFGKASMFTLFVSICIILIIFGTDQTFVRFYYEEDKHKRGALLYNCIKIVLLMLVPVILFIFIIRENLLEFLFAEYSIIVFVAIIVAILSQVIYRFGVLVIRMQQKGNLYSLIQIFNSLFILIGVFIFYQLYGSSYVIVIFSSTISFLILMTFLIYSQQTYWSLKNFRISNTYNTKLDILKHSYPFLMTTAIMWIFEGMDKLAIRYWADFNELGLYSVAFKIIGILSIIKISFTTFWTPIAYENFEKDPNNTMFYSNVTRIISFIMIIVSVLVIMFKDIILMFFGSNYENAGVMLSFLVFIPLMYTISETTVIGINFYKKVNWHILIVSITCIINLVGNWLLVPEYGGLGAAISTGLCYIIFFSLRTVISLYYYKVNYGLKKIYISSIVLLLLSSYTLLSEQPLNEIIVGLITILIIIMIYLKDIKDFYKLKRRGA